jgi:hypothetical protein
MHLVGPWLNTAQKKKGKQKFRNAEQARLARQADAQWEQMKKQWNIADNEKKQLQKLSKKDWNPPAPKYRGSEEPKVPSIETTFKPCLKKESPKYTGTLIKGIAQTHKSNAVPVIDDQHIKDIAHMRR